MGVQLPTLMPFSILVSLTDLLLVKYLKLILAVDVLLKPTGDAPIMKKRKWTVERTKKISSVIDFVRKYLKFEPQDSLVSSNSLLS